MNNMRGSRILLIGFRGCGKTTIGKRLAAMLRWGYLSTDQLIEEKADMAVNEIVKSKGWRHFRKLESEVLGELIMSNNSVIDTGGGAVIEHQREIDQLLTASLVVWINAYLEDIIQRLNDDNDRPLLNQNNIIKDIKFNYKKRQLVYQKLADLNFNTSLESVEKICKKIIQEMR